MANTGTDRRPQRDACPFLQTAKAGQSRHKRCPMQLRRPQPQTKIDPDVMQVKW